MAYNPTVQNLYDKVKDNVFPSGADATIPSNMIPESASVFNIGSSSSKFKAVYADEVHISENTLYLGDTEVLNMDANSVTLKSADSQSISISSPTINQTASATINLTAPTINLSGNTIIDHLTLSGDTVSIESTNLEVKDNIIELNKGEAGEGVSLGTAGISVDRGTLDSAQLVFDESDDSWHSKIGSSSYRLIDASIGTSMYVSKNGDQINGNLIVTGTTQLNTVTSNTLTVGDTLTLNGYELSIVTV